MFQHPAARLDPRGFADGLHGDGDRHLFCLCHLVQIHMDHLAAQGVMLDFLNERQALRQLKEQVKDERRELESFIVKAR